ncbi:hypothetical protein D3C79_783470 [compost metagenome]
MGQLVAKAGLYPVPQQEAGAEKGQGGTEGAGKGHQQQPPTDAKEGAAPQGQQAGAGQGEGGAEHVDEQEQQGGQGEVLLYPDGELRLACLQLAEVQIAAEIEGEEGGDEGPHHQQEQQAGARHQGALSWG